MTHSLATKITFGSLLKFTLPTVIMMLCTSLYSIVDGMFAARFISTDALSAINIVFPLQSIVIAVGTMFGTGVTAIVAKKLGQGKKQEARENFTFITLCAFGFSILFTVGTLVFMQPILHALGANDAIYGYCFAYAVPLMLFQPASVLQLQFQYAMIADSKPNMGLASSLIGGVVNIGLDYFFIVILDMGIAGAALGTGLGFCIPSVVGLIYFSGNRKGLLCFVRPRAEGRVLLNSITNGSSEMVSNLSVSVTTLLFNLIMMRYLAQDGVAAITIVLYLDFLLVAVGLGYSMGVAPLISYNYGSGETEKLRRIFRISVILCSVFSLVITVGTIIFARPLVRIFAKPDTDVFRFAVAGLSIYAFGYLFKIFNLFSSAMFTAFSNGRVSAILSFVRTLLFLVPCTLGLTLALGANGVWYAVPIAELLSLVVGIWYLWKLRGRYHYL